MQAAEQVVQGKEAHGKKGLVPAQGVWGLRVRDLGVRVLGFRDLGF